MTGAKRRKLNKDAGFSLLELLIAVIILAIIVIPMLNLFLTSNRLNIRSRQTLRATTVAQDIMEGLKAYDIEELKYQFNNPTEGFYVIDDNLIKGAVGEVTSREVDEVTNDPCEGLYYFSMSKVSMQGSEYDALIRVDAREYIEPGVHRNAYDGDPLVLNKAIADARSIDKKNGTFVEEDEIRKSVLNSLWNIPNQNQTADPSSPYYDPTAPKDLKQALEEAGVDVDTFRNKLCFKNIDSCFSDYGRTITMVLEDSAELDEDGRPKIEVSVTQEYSFGYDGFNCSTTGDDSHRVDGVGCGLISRANPNINIFYYPLYGNSVLDESIVIIDNTDPALSLPTDSKLSVLIAKQAPPSSDPTSPMYDPNNPEIMTDAQLMKAEMSYCADVKIKKAGSDMSKDQFTLKTNLGINLAGKAYVTGAGETVDTPSQLTVNGQGMDLSGTSQMNIYTLDGVRSLMGAAAEDGEVTELFYNVEISVYEEGAADRDFPEEERMVVLEGSKNN